MSDELLNIEEFLGELQRTDSWQKEDVYIIEGCRQLYMAAGKDSYKSFLLQALECIVDQEGNLSMGGESGVCSAWMAGIGRTLFWAWEDSGADRYKKAINQLVEALKCQNVQGQDARMLYLTQPFYMEYETKCHSKAAYKSIVQQMTQAAESMAGQSGPDFGWYLMSLVDVIGSMSMEIYEHYRSLEEILKRAVRGYIGSKRGRTDDVPVVMESGDSLEQDVSGMLGYVILRACNQRNINPEKYWEIGRELTDNIDCQVPTNDKETVGIRMMIQAQLLLFHG